MLALPRTTVKREEREEGDALDDAASADEYAAKRVLLVAKVAAAPSLVSRG